MAHILLAEDDASMRDIYTTVFRLSGHTITAVSDGHALLATLAAEPGKPDLILLDIMMPKMNGLDTLRAIKKDPAYASYRDIPVLMLTNLTSLRGPEDLTYAIQLGALQYIMKSEQDPKEVVAKVERVLANNP